jgi:hypothetical protein
MPINRSKREKAIRVRGTKRGRRKKRRTREKRKK